MILNKKQKKLWVVLVTISTLALIAASILPYILR